MSDLLLGVHVVACNEEELLSRCLESVKDIADEIILVDTGSVDRTLEVAASYGATIVQTNWEDDFSKIRNLALSHAQTQWVFYLDADEALVKGKDQIREILRTTNAEAFFVEIDNILGSRTEERLRHQTVRMFRRDPDYRFRGRIHEQIIPCILEKHPIAKIENSPLQIVHRGYLPELLGRKDKIRRNLRILELSLQENPEDPFHLYNMGVTHCQLGNLQEAERYMKRAFELAPAGAAYRPTLIRDRTKILIERKDWTAAEQLLRCEIARYADYPDLYHLLGETLKQKGYLREALQTFQKAAHNGAAPSKYVTEAGMGTFRSYYEMAALAKELGAHAEALQFYRQALAFHPRYLPALIGWAETLHLLGQSDEQIRQQLQSLTRDALLLAAVLFGIGAYAEALALIKTTESLSFEGERFLCECLMQTGQFPEAYEKLGKLLASADQSRRETFIMEQALCRWSEERSLPFSFYKTLTRAEQQMYERVDRWLIENVWPDPVPYDLVERLMERAIQLRLIRMAENFSRLSSHLFLKYSKSLYRNGFVLMAADGLLQAMKNQQLDSEGLFMLAEILYDKGHFRHACALFEPILAETPGNEKARIAVSLCYLEMAQDTAIEILNRFPSHPVIQKDLERIQNSKQLLGGIRWHTTWNSAQRRNLHASAHDFAVYDRQK
ncbi:tetratricopeptide repeat-containing glycosyltransferase family 2 protein [Effusibacillus lacus]|uniref:Glycosyltransferase 2-like domain-containing protein n=1 Tax=Effusibacillus lacus TaxID=1348429 RepID=A0A292YEI4_9BACL|nr:TPR domain-containing glycosyltransferase [Effusibacillus lacus]TCS74942.1 glycosyltransferase involved in cell wall biosynthesis [Effusibacillus lacus]GAX91612.1 hypothetical protein EFBL_3302 [Effusibacillus lacus]